MQLTTTPVNATQCRLLLNTRMLRNQRLSLISKIVLVTNKYTIFIRIKAGLIYTPELKYTGYCSRINEINPGPV